MRWTSIVWKYRPALQVQTKVSLRTVSRLLMCETWEGHFSVQMVSVRISTSHGEGKALRSCSSMLIFQYCYVVPEIETMPASSSKSVQWSILQNWYALQTATAFDFRYLAVNHTKPSFCGRRKLSLDIRWLHLLSLPLEASCLVPSLHISLPLTWRCMEHCKLCDRCQRCVLCSILQFLGAWAARSKRLRILQNSWRIHEPFFPY